MTETDRYLAGEAGLRIGVLGRLLATRDGVAVRLPRGRTSVLLAVLAMSAADPVSVTRLAELIWPDDQPESVRASLHNLVARLRVLVPGAIVTVGEGYLLDVDPDHVDLLRFRRLVAAAGEAGDPAAARRLLGQALALWRGEPLSDLRSAALDRDVIPGLIDEQLSAVQQRADLDLAAGGSDQLIVELRSLAGRYPLRESLWVQFLRALVDAGRPAEAMQEYHRVREVLATELGVDPSPELQELYHQLLQAERYGTAPQRRPARPGKAAALGDGPAGVVSHGLPADTRVFAGRQAELRSLLQAADAAAEGPGAGPVVVSAIDGMAGIGKTALAVRAAHQLAGRFGDGQLFMDLHGYAQDYPPRTANDALERFLRALGVPPQLIPDDTEERAALYRERLAGTRTLIVLDNVADEAQVRPLIPGQAGCLVVITSRRKLRALDDAHTVALDLLPERDAVALFCLMAGPGRVAADDPVAREIAGLCGYLPLAVRIAAALLRNRPSWAPDYIAGKLRAAPARLDALRDGDRDLAALFDLSSQTLTEEQRRLYRYLGLIPGSDIAVHAAAALLDTDPARADRLLQALVDHNVLLEPAAGRYRMHDLIRAHAQTLTGDEPGSEAALGRLLDYYQDTARRADAALADQSRPAPPAPAARAPAFPDAGAARRWLRAERANLTACFQYAVQRARDDRVVALSAGLAGLLLTDGPWPQASAVHTVAAAAAARLGDRPAQARALTELGALGRLTGDYAGADGNLQTALKLWRAAGDQHGQAHTLTELGILRRVSGDYPGATRNQEAALVLWRATGDRSGQARAKTELGGIRKLSGDYAGAARELQAALGLSREAGGGGRGEGRVLDELADAQRLAGDYEAATRNAEAAVDICTRDGDRLGQANALSDVGKLCRLTGDYPAAARHQQAALDVYRELGDRLGQANTRTLLAELRRLNGDYAAAARDLEESIATYRDLGVRGNEAWALNHYGAVISDAGDAARAIPVYREALRLALELQQPDEEAIALEGLGEACLRRGETGAGVDYLRQARGTYQQLGMPAAGHVSTRLAEIGSLDGAAQA